MSLSLSKNVSAANLKLKGTLIVASYIYDYKLWDKLY